MMRENKDDTIIWKKRCGMCSTGTSVSANLSRQASISHAGGTDCWKNTSTASSQRRVCLSVLASKTGPTSFWNQEYTPSRKAGKSLRAKPSEDRRLCAQDPETYSVDRKGVTQSSQRCVSLELRKKRLPL